MVTGSFSPIGVSLDNLFYVGICNFHIFFKLFGLILFNILYFCCIYIITCFFIYAMYIGFLFYFLLL